MTVFEVADFTGFLCHFSGRQVLRFVLSDPEGDRWSDHTEEKTQGHVHIYSSTVLKYFFQVLVLYLSLFIALLLFHTSEENILLFTFI